MGITVFMSMCIWQSKLTIGKKCDKMNKTLDVFKTGKNNKIIEFHTYNKRVKLT